MAYTFFPVHKDIRKKPLYAADTHPKPGALAADITGWAHNNSTTRHSGEGINPKEGYRDDITWSDWRGHSLDAPQYIAAGSCYVSYGCVFQRTVSRDTHHSLADFVLKEYRK